MPGDAKNPEMGELSVDASEFAPIIVDLPNGGTQGLKVEQEGCPEVVAEIVANQPVCGAKAGVSQEEVTELQAAHVNIARLDRFIPVVAKLYELLTETRAVLADDRERLIRAVAWSVDAKAGIKGNEPLVAKYEKTRAYRSAPGDKAAKTRKKHASNKAEKAAIDKAASEKAAGEKNNAPAPSPGGASPNGQ